MRRLSTTVACVLALLVVSAPSVQASFGFKAGKEGFSVAVRTGEGKPSSAAGTHPYEWSMHLGLNEAAGFPDGDLRDLRIETPQGMLLNPTFQGSVASDLVKCSLVDFHTPRDSPYETSLSGESCPLYTQVGTVELRTSFGGGTTRRFGLFNLKAPPGLPAQLGAAPFGSPVVFDVTLVPDSTGRYTLSLEARDFSQALDVSGIDLNLWGVPWATAHDPERGNCLNETNPAAYHGQLSKIEIIEKEGKKIEKFIPATCGIGPPGEYPPKAFLTLPTECLASLAFTARADAWQQPGQVSATAANLNSLDQAEPLSACSSLPFTPLPLGLLNQTKASSASGYDFRLTADQEGLFRPTQPVASAARKVVVHLPQGVTVNPSVGAGLIGCTPGQYAAENAFNGQGSGCPNGSKIGDFFVNTPLFENVAGKEFFDGAIYLAQPRDNPFGGIVAVYLVAKLPSRGVMVKLAGRIDPDPGDGTVTATFEGLPELPYTDLQMNFRSGQRAFLISPPSCGQAITRTEMTPWSNETTVSGTPTSSDITSGADFGPCPAPGAIPPFAVDAVTGGINSNVNSYTPYYVHLTRHDTDQEITSYSLILPKGITGKLAGIPFCPEANIEASRQNTGVGEETHPSCPAASQVGRTLTGYGVGPALTYASGRVYLAGPYHGAPLSLVTVNSATVGPFDLGTIIIRSAFQVDPHTAQLRIDSSASDPIPHIIGGIPLHLREVRIYMDRPGFTHNPSSCEPSQLESALTGSGATFESKADDSLVTVARHFQLLNCSTLGFKPKLGIRLRGNPRRGAYPQLRATFAARGPQDSNLKRIEVEMPHAEFLAQNHIREVCTRIQFNAKTCPQGSVYGTAVAYTPLLDEPLRGNVYLRSSTSKLPDLVADLYSGAVRIIVEGHIGPTRQGGVDVFFGELPDQPLDRFVMTLRGGKHGLLTNSVNICSAPPFASVSSVAQNNTGAKFNTVLRGTCGKKGKGKGKTTSKGSGGKGKTGKSHHKAKR